MIRTASKPATAIVGLVLGLVSSTTLHADSGRPSSVPKHASAGPSVTTYAAGLSVYVIPAR